MATQEFSIITSPGLAMLYEYAKQECMPRDGFTVVYDAPRQGNSGSLGIAYDNETAFDRSEGHAALSISPLPARGLFALRSMGLKGKVEYAALDQHPDTIRACIRAFKTVRMAASTVLFPA